MKSFFRTWLVQRVSEARIRKSAKMSLEDQAKHLGIQPDVLLEAEAVRKKRIEDAGRQGYRRGVPSNTYYDGYTRRIKLYMPEQILRPLEAVCTARNIDFQDLARAAVQTLLSGPDNPRYAGKGWVYKGKRLTPGRTLARCFWVSTGADIALGLRAERAGVTKTGLVRGVLIDVIEGRVKRLLYTDLTSMWNDPSRYWTGETA